MGEERKGAGGREEFKGACREGEGGGEGAG